MNGCGISSGIFPAGVQELLESLLQSLFDLPLADPADGLPGRLRLAPAPVRRFFLRWAVLPGPMARALPW
jgi:hypothetical protein